MPRRTSLIDRGYLHAQKRAAKIPCVPAGQIFPNISKVTVGASQLRLALALAWRVGYLQAQRDAKRR